MTTTDNINHLYEGYLTEAKLGDALRILFGEDNVESQVKVQNTRYRSDFKVGDMIVEFDGYRHFQCHSTILRDRKVKEYWTNLGYKFVVIPYFLQLDSLTIKHYFGLETEYEKPYPHGFIDKSALRPRNYNILGQYKFEEMLKNDIPYTAKKDILSTIEFGVDYGIYFSSVYLK